MSTITIRRASVKDAAAYARMMGHPEVFPQVLQVPFNDEEVWKARLTESTAADKPDLRNGQYVDAHSMARLHPNPPRLASAAP